MRYLYSQTGIPTNLLMLWHWFLTHDLGNLIHSKQYHYQVFQIWWYVTAPCLVLFLLLSVSQTQNSDKNKHKRILEKMRQNSEFLNFVKNGTFKYPTNEHFHIELQGLNLASGVPIFKIVKRVTFLTPHLCPLANGFEYELTWKCITTKACQIWEQSIQPLFSSCSHNICTAKGGWHWYENGYPLPPFTARDVINTVYFCVFKSSFWLLMSNVIYTRPWHLEFS